VWIGATQTAARTAGALAAADLLEAAERVLAG